MSAAAVAEHPMSVRGALAELLIECVGREQPPLAAQLVYVALRILPPAQAEHIGSREFRRAASELFPSQIFRPTRGDIVAGFVWLKAHALDPREVIR